MIPENLSPEIPTSERYVYGRLKAALPESWIVIHGRRFLLPGKEERSPHEGELDFLVVDPRKGAIGLEVKDGGIERGKNGWFSMDRGGGRHPIRDPGAQASAATHAIAR